MTRSQGFLTRKILLSTAQPGVSTNCRPQTACHSAKQQQTQQEEPVSCQRLLPAVQVRSSDRFWWVGKRPKAATQTTNPPA